MAQKKIRTGVQVSGLRELNKSLKELGPDLQKELPAANRRVATMVADTARSKALSLGGVAAKSAPSISVRAGAQSAGVGFGGPRAPYAGGAEFGAYHDVPRKRSTGTYLGYNQFKPWRGSGPQTGYFVFPAIRQDSERIVDEYGQLIDALLAKAFPD